MSVGEVLLALVGAGVLAIGFATAGLASWAAVVGGACILGYVLGSAR